MLFIMVESRVEISMIKAFPRYYDIPVYRSAKQIYSQVLYLPEQEVEWNGMDTILEIEFH